MLKHKRVYAVLLVLCIFVMSAGVSFAGQDKNKKKQAMKPDLDHPLFKIKGDGVGYTLLNKVVFVFEGASKYPAAEFSEKIKQALVTFTRQAQKARQGEKIDKKFFDRFIRVLRVIGLVMANDKEHALMTPYIVDTVNQFHVKQKLPEEFDGPLGLGQIAGALAEELLSLKKYLDNKSKTK